MAAAAPPVPSKGAKAKEFPAEVATEKKEPEENAGGLGVAQAVQKGKKKGKSGKGKGGGGVETAGSKQGVEKTEEGEKHLEPAERRLGEVPEQKAEDKMIADAVEKLELVANHQRGKKRKDKGSNAVGSGGKFYKCAEEEELAFYSIDPTKYREQLQKHLHDALEAGAQIAETSRNTNNPSMGANLPPGTMRAAAKVFQLAADLVLNPDNTQLADADSRKTFEDLVMEAIEREAPEIMSIVKSGEPFAEAMAEWERNLLFKESSEDEDEAVEEKTKIEVVKEAKGRKKGKKGSNGGKKGEGVVQGQKQAISSIQAIRSEAAPGSSSGIGWMPTYEVKETVKAQMEEHRRNVEKLEKEVAKARAIERASGERLKQVQLKIAKNDALLEELWFANGTKNGMESKNLVFWEKWKNLNIRSNVL